MIFQIGYLINESPSTTNRSITNLIHEKIIFIRWKIHGNVFIYIYVRKIWIVKYVNIPIDCPGLAKNACRTIHEWISCGLCYIL